MKPIEIDDRIQSILAEPKPLNKPRKEIQPIKKIKINKADIKSLSILPSKIEIPKIEEPEKEDKYEIPSSIRNAAIIKAVLTKEELGFFIERWNEYYATFGADLNTANDYDQMVELIMCLVDQFRIQKKKKTSDRIVLDPNVDQIMHRIHTRIQNILSAFYIKRKDRVEAQDKKDENIIKLLVNLAKK